MGAAIVLQAVRTTPFCAVVAESPFASFRQIAYIRVGQMFHTGSWLGRVVLRPAVELALVYGKLTRGVDLSEVSPQNSVARSRIPILLIHGLADANIPAQQSEMIRSQNPEDVVLWEVPGPAIAAQSMLPVRSLMSACSGGFPLMTHRSRIGLP